MSERPQVSIIVANFNGAPFLGAAIDSVRAQTLTSWEMILVDDASTDASLTIAREASAGDGRIRVLAQSVNRGPAAARNRALEDARGEWIAIFDSDDVMAPERLARLLERARAHGARIVADNQLICSADLTPERRFLSPRNARAVETADIALFIQSSRLYSSYPDLGFLKPMFHASLLDQTGARYMETLRVGEDFHFMLRLLAGGERVSIDPHPLYFYRKHSASISHRMTAETIGRMIAADEAFAQSAPLNASGRLAVGHRIEGLKTWAAYEQIIEALKQGRGVAAWRLILSRPLALPLLLRAAWDRLGRLLAAAKANFAWAVGRRPLRPAVKASAP